MALDDKDIFAAIFDKFSDQSIEFVMAQYEKAKRLNREIERRLTENLPPEADGIAVAVAETGTPDEEKAMETPRRKKYSRRDLVCKPEEAISDASIKCCLCGKEGSSLTSRHLAQHGISVEEYKHLCGYADDQKLMSRNFELKMLRNVQRAQQVRMNNLKEKAEADA